MNETTTHVVVNKEDEETWKSHFLYAQNFSGSDSEYCRRNGLNERTFKKLKIKYGFTKPRRRREKLFVQLQNSATHRESIFSERPQAASSVNRTLPDAKWVASFVVALLDET